MKEHLLVLKTVNKFYAAAWGIILLTADTSATPLANKKTDPNVTKQIKLLESVKGKLLNSQAPISGNRLYDHLFGRPGEKLESLDKEEKGTTSSFGLQYSTDYLKTARSFIDTFCDPNRVESIKIEGKEMYTITLDNPKPGQNFGTGYTFDFYKKQWYQGPYNQVQVKLQENGCHSFYPLLDEKQWHEVSPPKKQSLEKWSQESTYTRSYKPPVQANPYASFTEKSKSKNKPNPLKEKEQEVLVSESSSGSEEKPLLEVKNSEENASSNSSSSQELIEEIAQTSPENLTQQGCCQKLKEWRQKAINCLKEQAEKVTNFFRYNPQSLKKDS